MASAIIDRIVHHAVIVKVTGKSYRIKNLAEVQDLYKTEENSAVKRGRPKKAEGQNNNDQSGDDFENE
jgi:hypothetical protein